jgi:antirestriction protein
MLKGQELITKVTEIREDVANAARVIPMSEIVLACGYVKDNGKPDFIAFYTELIEAKGLNEPTEDPEMSDTEAELREVHGDDAVDAFIEIWSVDDLDYFEDAYCGEYGSGAKFAEDLVTGNFGIDNLPTFVEINWEATWENLRYDYYEQDGFIFNANW